MELFILIKTLSFIGILIYASIIDIKTKTVPNHIYFMLLIVGFINVSPLSFIGLLVSFFPIFICAVAKDGIGGGDVKLCGMIGFVMKDINGLIAILIGLIIAIIFIFICRLIKKEKINSPFALVPYISMGCLCFIFFSIMIT